MEGKIPWHKLLMVNNMNALIQQCVARRIATISAGGKQLTWFNGKT